LGIPTVLDRLIQQSLNQVLQPLFDHRNRNRILPLPTHV
jgi:retron-type reverse transcriptase